MNVKEANDHFKSAIRTALYVASLNVPGVIGVDFTLVMLKCPDVIDGLVAGRDVVNDLIAMSLFMVQGVWKSVLLVLERLPECEQAIVHNRQIGEEATAIARDDAVKAIGVTVAAVNHALGALSAVTGIVYPPVVNQQVI